MNRNYWIVAALLSLVQYCFAQQQAGFNDLQIGQSKASAIKSVPKAECFVNWNGSRVIAEICNIKPPDLADPIFAGTEAKLSFHIQNEVVSAISVLIPASQITNIADRIKVKYGAWIPVQSPIAQKKNKQAVALLWDLGTSRLIFDFEATESGEYLLLAIPAQKR